MFMPPLPVRRAAVALAVLAASPAAAAPLASVPDTVPGEVIVRYRADVAQAGRIDVLADSAARFRRALPIRGVHLVRAGAGRTVAQTLSALRADPRVAWAEPNGVMRAQALPNDPRMGELWGLHNTGQVTPASAFSPAGAGTPDADIDAPEAWDITTGSPSVVVAVVDSGVNTDHPDIAPNVWTNPGEIAGNNVDDDANGFVDDVHGWDFVDGDADPRDTDPLLSQSHGTHVAGTIAARGDDGAGITGVSWTSRIMPLRVLGGVNGGGSSGSDADIAAAFTYAAQNGARVVNASLGGQRTQLPQVMKAAIDAAPGTLFVVAAGNVGSDNDTVPFYPCNFTSPNVLCVAASGPRDELASFSNRGPANVDIAAPGMAVRSATTRTSVAFTDDFETAPLGWTGGWARESGAGSSGTWSMSDSPGTTYAAGSNNVTSRTFDLTGRRGCGMDYAFDLESEFRPPAGFDDPLTVEAGAVELRKWAGTTRAPASPDTPVFITDTVRLSAFDGGPVQVRFRLTADASTQFDGARIDDVTVSCADDTTPYTGADDEYRVLDGTSMATPHVAGVAALLAAAEPALTAVQMKQRILATGDPRPSLTGRVASGARLNARSALDPPALISAPLAGSVTAAGATVTAAVTTRERAATVTVQYGLTPAYELGTLPGGNLPAATARSVAVPLTGLAPGTTYHYRFTAVTPNGTASATADAAFTTGTLLPAATPPPPGVTTAVAPPPPAAPPGAKVPAVKLPVCGKLKGRAKTRCLLVRRAMTRCVTRFTPGVRRTACLKAARAIKLPPPRKPAPQR